MGCFPACFSSNRRKRHNSFQELKTTEALQPTEPEKREKVGELIRLIRESREEVEEQESRSAKKRVTFDLNFKSNGESSAKEVPCDSVEGKEDKKSGNEEEVLKESRSAKKRVTFDLNFKSNGESSAKEVPCDSVEGKEDKKSGNEEEVLKETEPPLLDAIALSKVAFFTQNNRYRDCRKSTDECEDIGLDDIELEDGEEDGDDDYGSGFDDKGVVVQEESSESLFSLSIDSRKQVCDAEKGEKEVNSPMPIQGFSVEEVKVKATGSCRSAGKKCQFSHSVLNPIENFAKWKEVKERPTSPFVKHQDKENISLEQDMSIVPSPEPSLKLAKRSSKPNSSEMKQEIRVDTSLSSWLVESETTLKSRASDNHSVENSESEKERELKPVSASLSPTRSRSQSPRATPIIGTVGSYWIHTGQNMDSDSSSSGKRITVTEREKRKDQTVSCNSTPFEARLGGAVDTGVC